MYISTVEIDSRSAGYCGARTVFPITAAHACTRSIVYLEEIEREDRPQERLHPDPDDFGRPPLRRISSSLFFLPLWALVAAASSSSSFMRANHCGFFLFLNGRWLVSLRAGFGYVCESN